MLKKVLIIIGIVFAILVLVGIIAIAVIYSEPKLAVINYHNVLTKEEIANLHEKKSLWAISVDNFEEQMKYLHDHNYKTLTMEEFAKWKEGELEVPFKSVLITFDDGLLSNYHYAIPILKKYNLNATIFVIGKTSEQIKDEANIWKGAGNSYVSKAQIEDIRQNYPNIELYSHTYDMHRKIEDKPAVYSYTEEQMREDINLYEQYMGKAPYIAYPFGATNEAWVKVLRESGYSYGFLLGDNKKVTRSDDNFYLNRINTSSDKDLFHFAVRLLLPY